jgi:hypothetical protein
VVHLIPILQYSNVYSTTPLLRKLADSKEIQDECAKYVSKLGRENNKNYSLFIFHDGLAAMTFLTKTTDCFIFYLLFIYLFYFLFFAYSPTFAKLIWYL